MYVLCVLLYMNRQIQYSVMIASIAAVLISGSMFSVEAKTFDKESEISLKGSGVAIFAKTGVNSLQLQVSTIENSKNVLVDFRAFDGVKLTRGIDCIASDKIIKISSNKKASVSLNTADLSECKIRDGGDSIISASFVGNGLYNENEKYDETICEDKEGIEFCSRDHGSKTEFLGIGTISGFGLTLVDEDAAITKEKLRHTEWTSP